LESRLIKPNLNQEALADEGGMKAEKARETLEMTIFDCKEDIKDKEKTLEIKTKTQVW
jgi:hypothetical protein